MLGGDQRILRFGDDRTIFFWSNAKLLVKKLGTKVDILAILMDAVESSLRKIDCDKLLGDVIVENDCHTSELMRHFEDMVDDLKSTLMALGVTGISLEQEEILTELVENHRHSAEVICQKMNRKSAFIKELLKGPENNSNKDDSFLL